MLALVGDFVGVKASCWDVDFLEAYDAEAGGAASAGRPAPEGADRHVLLGDRDRRLIDDEGAIGLGLGGDGEGICAVVEEEVGSRGVIVIDGEAVEGQAV